MTYPITYKTNQIINNLIFLEEVKPYINPNSGQKVRKAKFLCVCGDEFEALINQVKGEGTNSCGCCREGKIRKNTKHGLKGLGIYAVWVSMKQRCYNQNHKQYKDYGGRGIMVCNEWRYDFKAFYNWVLVNGYKTGLTIDRRNNDGNYESSNCRFITRAENNRNKRKKITKDTL